MSQNLGLPDSFLLMLFYNEVDDAVSLTQKKTRRWVTCHCGQHCFAPAQKWKDKNKGLEQIERFAIWILKVTSISSVKSSAEKAFHIKLMVVSGHASFSRFPFFVFNCRPHILCNLLWLMTVKIRTLKTA